MSMKKGKAEFENPAKTNFKNIYLNHISKRRIFEIKERGKQLISKFQFSLSKIE